MTVKRQGFAPTGDQSQEPLDVSRFKPRRANPDTVLPPAARTEKTQDVAIAAMKAGFTSRTGARIDGRSLRRTGRTEQLNAKVEPEVKDAIVMEAARRGIAVGQLIKEMNDLYHSVREGEGDQ